MLTIQTHDSIKGWIDTAELRFSGSKNEVVSIEYDIDYATECLQAIDLRALSITFPVSLNPVESEIPGYLMDLIPQGKTLKRLLSRFGIKENDYQAILSQIPLVSPGNIRIKEAWDNIEEERPYYSHKGFPKSDILSANQNFLAYMEEHGAPIGGTSGAAGGAPKFLLREDHNSHFHADGYLDDDITKQAWLVKFPFTDSDNSKLLLRAEQTYHDVLTELGLRTAGKLEWYKDILFIPRFDRIREVDKHLHYYGLESFYSAHNINTYGSILTHEANLQLISNVCDDPQNDLIEYLKRDIANQALGNTDNHGRNWSLIKKKNSIALSPQYDVTAMRLFEGDFIVPLTRWHKSNPDLSTQVEWIDKNTKLTKEVFRTELEHFFQILNKLEDILELHDVPKTIIEKTKQDRSKCIETIKVYLRQK